MGTQNLRCIWTNNCGPFASLNSFSNVSRRNLVQSHASEYQSLTSLLSISGRLTTTLHALPSFSAALPASIHSANRQKVSLQVTCAAPRPRPSTTANRRSPSYGKKGGSGSGGNRAPVFAEDNGPQRLNKAIASAGVASRRAADDLIFEGRVSVNGKVVQEPGTRVDMTKDKVTVDGKPVSRAAASQKYYFALNKPKGFICSNKGDGSGGAGDRLVVDLFAHWLKKWKEQHPGSPNSPRLYTVGRLDVQSVGLIFVTNDGDWAQKVQHPSSGITKEYSVTLDRKPTKAQMDAMMAGVDIDGAFVTPVALALDDSDPGRSYRLRVVIAEGRNREVRRLAEAAGLTVRGLRRLRFGGYRLPRTLGFGEFVELKPWEVRRILDIGADRSM